MRIFIFFLGLFPLAAMEYDVLVLGGGPAGLSCALYLSRANIATCVLEGSNPGGMIAKSHLIENWPGEMRISGEVLAENMRNQVIKNGASIRPLQAEAVDLSKSPYEVQVRHIYSGKKETLRARYLVIATGSSPNFLGIPGEKTYFGRGVSTCAICDGNLFSKKKVAIVGGGDSAIVDAQYLAKIASEVHIFVRKKQFKATDHLRVKQVIREKNVFVHMQASLQEIMGNKETITGIRVKEKDRVIFYPIEGLFLAIGSKPNTNIFRGKLPLTSRGHIVLKKGQETAIPGVYAAGDVAEPVYNQAVCACAYGAQAAMEIQHKFFANQTLAKNKNKGLDGS